ncbi:MAG TPA: hypothetical protein DEF00_00675 [Candidatus Taylorbacteria bacterium]|nr:MAG: hypothetical protein UY03_C0011G0007 [Parcubacteria group bacterium GW2011_GWA2_47_64]KKU95683.1 MAG: hypothetical protein UY29_C0021G0003 [Parcubacteria group bacterium GW2011_GWC2_48_17]HBV00894.1 hypothetical protein [Candidatus Taylorbacteria bacterium]
MFNLSVQKVEPFDPSGIMPHDMHNQNQKTFETGGSNTLEAFDPIFELKKVAENARDRVKQEFSRSQNTWLDCFINDLSVLLQIIDTKLLPPQLEEIAKRRYTALLEKVLELKEEYPTRETIPPVSVQDELFSALRIID